MGGLLPGQPPQTVDQGLPLLGIEGGPEFDQFARQGVGGIGY